MASEATELGSGSPKHHKKLTIGTMSSPARAESNVELRGIELSAIESKSDAKVTGAASDVTVNVEKGAASDHERKEEDEKRILITGRPRKRYWIQTWAFDNIVDTHWFHLAVFWCIVLNGIALGFTNPLTDSESTLAQVLDVCETTFEYIFLVEMLVKMVALGLYQQAEPEVYYGLPTLSTSLSLARSFSLLLSPSR